jgi:hypothetical protein
MPELNITAIVETFASQITAAVEASVTQRLQSAIAGAFGAPAKRGPGRPPKPVAAVATVTEKKKRPKQLCPVPGCKNLAAPVFGMVCSDHKNVAKSKIKKYRQERKAAPSSAAKASPAKQLKKATPKAARARKIQGQYMGALKSLTGADREKVKQTAKDKGVAEAVKLALSMKKSKA